MVTIRILESFEAEIRHRRYACGTLRAAVLADPHASETARRLANDGVVAVGDTTDAAALVAELKAVSGRTTGATAPWFRYGFDYPVRVELEAPGALARVAERLLLGDTLDTATFVASQALGRGDEELAREILTRLAPGVLEDIDRAVRPPFWSARQHLQAMRADAATVTALLVA